MKYYIIAGEASGDLHAANCVREILKLDPGAEFRFTGGEKLERAAGMSADIHIRRMAFMGFVDVLKNAGIIRQNFKTVKKEILSFRPDVLLLVDYPGFNLRMARWASEHGIRVDFYISPTVWAWKEGRVETIKRYTHKLFAILPFEEQFYADRGHKVYFLGHPLVDEVEHRRKQFRPRSSFFSDNNLPDKPLIAVLPGSRKQEIERMLGIMTEVVRYFPGYAFVIAGSANLPASYYEGLSEKGIHVLFDQTYELMEYSAAGIIKSGTSTLEAALLRLPEVVCYKGGGLSFAIGKRLVNVKYISLVNLIMDKPVVKELIQDDLTVENIRTELDRLLNDQHYRESILSEYESLMKCLGGPGASARIAAEVVKDAAGLKAAEKKITITND
jgi:lipid-A-disaccharide synthase